MDNSAGSPVELSTFSFGFRKQEEHTAKDAKDAKDKKERQGHQVESNSFGPFLSFASFTSLASWRSYSWLRHGAIAAAEVAPLHVEWRIVVDGELGRQFFVEVDPQAGFVVGPVVSVLERWTTGEHVLFRLREVARLLNAEIVSRQVEMDIGGVADRRDITGSVPGRADGEEFTEGRDFAGHR